eukprot:2596073-Pyramimonas_sp.AAC.1
MFEAGRRAMLKPKDVSPMTRGAQTQSFRNPELSRWPLVSRRLCGLWKLTRKSAAPPCPCCSGQHR